MHLLGRHAAARLPSGGVPGRPANLQLLPSVYSVVRDGNMKTEWRPVPRLSGYEVSNTGRIRNQQGEVSILRSSLGYSVINKNGAPVLIHRCVLLAFVGPPPGARIWCKHENGIKTDNRLSNLKWSTPSESAQHSFDVGLQEKQPNDGENNGNSKLTRKKAKDIRTLRMSIKKFAKFYGVTENSIRNVQAGRTWNDGTLPVRTFRPRKDWRGNPTLTWEDVQEIRRLAPDVKRKDLAKKFGVKYHTIYKIIKGITWKPGK